MDLFVKFGKIWLRKIQQVQSIGQGIKSVFIILEIHNFGAIFTAMMTDEWSY